MDLYFLFKKKLQALHADVEIKETGNAGIHIKIQICKGRNIVQNP